ncbi:MAG: adenosine deaminase [Spirochaeta sp.]|nr:adenosine deaminase [Spirochaeta sp.]
MKGTDESSKQGANLLTPELIRSFPKVELHRHLEGSFPVRSLFEIAHKNGLDMPSDYDAFKEQVQFPKDSEPDFLKFLSKFKNTWYRSFDDVYRIAYDSVKEFANDGLYYIELRFSPEHFAFHNNFDRNKITKLVIQAGNDAAAEIDLKIKYLITFNRSKQDQNEMSALYEEIKRLNLPDIVGMDLAGDEINFPPELFTEFFSKVNSDGVYKSTIHAGEVSASDQIWKAVKLLGASRIGHGTSCVDDEELKAYLTEHQVVLEQCITSNYQTGSWVDEKNHPLGRLYREGVPVSINSDDPFIQDTDLTDDYVKTVRYFGFTIDDLIALNLTALRSVFLSDSEKQNLIDEYTRRVAAFRKKYGI